MMTSIAALAANDTPKPGLVHRRGVLCAGLTILTGCAQNRAPSTRQEDFWSGRLAVQVPDDPSQSFSASFELKGNSLQGEMTFLSPLGNRVAHLQWNSERAQLTLSKDDVRSSSSLDQLIVEATGTSLPIAALFDWLSGTETQIPGWSTDFSGRPQGRLLARRHTPSPAVTLRIALND